MEEERKYMDKNNILADMGNFSILKEEIERMAKKADYEIEHSHMLSVFEWVLRLKPDADLALKIAALGHDIERYDENKVKRENFDSYEKFKRAHAQRSATITSNLMNQYGFNEQIIQKTAFLIANHEVGGEGDVEIIKDADSLSFFDNNVYSYWKTHSSFFKDKIMFMYSRLSTRGKTLFKEIFFKDKIIEEEINKIVQEYEKTTS